MTVRWCHRFEPRTLLRKPHVGRNKVTQAALERRQGVARRFGRFHEPAVFRDRSSVRSLIGLACGATNTPGYAAVLAVRQRVVVRKSMHPWDMAAFPGKPTAAVGQAISPSNCFHDLQRA